MQMRKRYLLFLTAFFFIACKKESHEAPGLVNGSVNTSTSLKLKTIMTSTDTISYTYDSKGRVDTITDINNGFFLKFTYTDTTVTDSTFYTLFDIPPDAYVYKLNSKGLAISSTGSLDIAGEDVYRYNADGQMTYKAYKYIGSPQIYEAWTNYYSMQNIDSIMDVQSFQTIMTYSTYDTDHPNTIGNENTGMLFLGASSKNPGKLAAIKTSLGFTDTTTYRYEYDIQNRISKSFMTHHSVTSETDYIYY